MQRIFNLHKCAVGGSERFGNCEICTKAVDTTYHLVSLKEYTKPDGKKSLTYNNELSVFGHKKCLSKLTNYYDEENEDDILFVRQDRFSFAGFDYARGIKTKDIKFESDFDIDAFNAGISNANYKYGTQIKLIRSVKGFTPKVHQNESDIVLRTVY